MPKYLMYIIIGVPAIALGLVLFIYFFQHVMVFHPIKLAPDYKFRFDGKYEERFFEVGDGVKLSALNFKVENPKGVVFYHHGNAGCLESWGYKAKDFNSLGYDLLVYDYRGFGKSTGKLPTEKQLVADANYIYKQLKKDYSESQIVLYGISLGSGIAAKLAQEHHPNKLILETPYYGFYEVAKFHFPYLPARLLLKYHFKTHKYLEKVDCPVYAIHGTNDLVVPYSHSQLLKEKFPKIDLFTIEGGSHSDLNTYPEYQQKLGEILASSSPNQK